jgi:serine protease Do
MMLKINRVATFGGLVAAAFLYWPVACASHAGQAQQAPGPNDLPSLMPAANAAHADPLPGLMAGQSIADVAERVTPSVVNIASERVVRAQQRGIPFFFGPSMEEPGEQKQQGQGSGVILSKDGIVVTNNHVVEEATDIKVTTSDKREFAAEVVGRDAKSDIAVLRLKGDLTGLKPVAVGDSTKLRLGEVVLAVGNPFGVGQTVTMGIVSAVGRADVGIEAYEDFIQTDAAINPGNSGGALINMRGELVGINTAILSRSGGYQGIGFAIPTKMVQPIADSLLKSGRVVRGFLGIGIQDVNAELAKALALPISRGVLVTEIQPGSAAAKAGLQRGDAIVRVDGETVDSSGRLRNLVAAKGANAKVKLDVIRAGKPWVVDVQTAELADKENAGAKEKSKGPGELGLEFSNLDAETRRELGMDAKTEGAVVVSRVARGSKAADSGIRPGDIVLEVNRVKVTSAEAAVGQIKGSKGDVLLLVSRRGASQFLLIKR